MKRKLRIKNTKNTAQDTGGLFATNAEWTVKQYEAGAIDYNELLRAVACILPRAGNSTIMDAMVFLGSTKCEIGLRFNHPLHDGFTEFRGTYRRSDGTSHDVLTYGDEFVEGIALTYLKLCAVAGKQL